jgi:glycosyltransferase involved in cell wall biosynthesis
MPERAHRLVVSRLSPPVLVRDLHLDGALPDLNADGRYRAARLLVRLHGQPIGEVVLPLAQQPLAADQLAGRIWPLIGDRAGDHCVADGMTPPAQLTSAGLTCPGSSRCAGRPLTAGITKISVVIATHDRTESLLRCLSSVSRLDYPAFDVVVVDSAPHSDATAQALSGHTGFPFPVSYLRVSRPGLALAHNAALPAVTGDVVAITDDDVEVDPNWLAALTAAFAESDATCVTGLILPAELETGAQLLVEQVGGYSRGFTRQVFTGGMPAPGPLFPFTAGRFGSGANMAFRADWLTANGGFDPATGAGSPARGGDDLTAFLKVIIDGGTLVYEPAAIVRHWHRRDYEGMRRQAFGYGMGLGAYLAASVRERPALLGSMLRRSAPALRHLLSAGSVKNAGRDESFPRELIWRERAGIVAGPLAYAVGRWRYRDCTAPPAGSPG